MARMDASSGNVDAFSIPPQHSAKCAGVDAVGDKSTAAPSGNLDSLSTHRAWCERLVAWRRVNDWHLPERNSNDVEEVKLAKWLSFAKSRCQRHPHSMLRGARTPAHLPEHPRPDHSRA